MAEQETPLGEFERGDFVFAVLPDGEVRRVEAREGAAPAVPVCRVFPYSYSEWSSNWPQDSWRPWIDQQARRIIAEADEAENAARTPLRHNQTT